MLQEAFYKIVDYRYSTQNIKLCMQKYSVTVLQLYMGSMYGVTAGGNISVVLGIVRLFEFSMLFCM